MTWDKGSGSINTLIQDGEMERVTASLEPAEVMLGHARRHLESAAAITQSDPLGAYVLIYDAGRKAIASLLEAQGARLRKVDISSCSTPRWRNSIPRSES